MEVEGRHALECPRQYRRAEVEETMEAEGMREGGDPRKYRSLEVEEAMELEVRGGGPRQYRRIEIQGRGGAEGCARRLHQGGEEGRS